MTIGIASAVVGVAVLLAWIPLRNRPGIGTIANVIVIAVTVDAGLWLLPTPTSLPVRIAMMVGAVVLNAFSTVLYIGAALGPGPRDGLMTGLVVRTGLSVRLVRTSIEATVLAVGWLLGGTVGVGTVLYAFGIGPLVQLFLRITPKRVLAVSGWASVAEASDLGVKSSARRDRARRNRELGRDRDSRRWPRPDLLARERSRWSVIRRAQSSASRAARARGSRRWSTCWSRIGAAKGDDWVAHIPMDGFHLADAQLDRIGARGRKGAPDTFDAAGYAHLLERVKREVDDPVYVPGLRPHAGTAARRGAGRAAVGAPRRHRGQLSAARRSALGAGAPRHGRRVVRRERRDQRIERLVARHIEFGKTPDEARAWVATTDQRNAELVAGTVGRADRVIVNGAAGWSLALARAERGSRHA